MSRTNDLSGTLIAWATCVVVALVAVMSARRAVNADVRRVTIAEAECRPGLTNDLERTRRLSDLLASTGEGRRLLERTVNSSPPVLPLRVCFGRVPVPAIVTNGTILLDERDADGESAARLGHLLLHAVEGMPAHVGADGERSCEHVVMEAITAEARAHAVELELRRALGVTRPSHVFPFERAFWAARPEERVEVLEEYFREHPEGGDGVPGFVEAYRRGCEATGRRR